MSHLSDLLNRASKLDPDLAKDLEREIAHLRDRREFGLNFERHTPESVELPGRPVRKGDTVRILPPRGETPTAADERSWKVERFSGAGAQRRAELTDPYGDETREALVSDLVVVAGFRDPIYPGLVSTGKVERGGDKPFHTVINAENYHALEALLFTHRHSIDAIYIDPPYNTGAKDWKYNNDYVTDEDVYRHSKWLAFMERRLLLAKELLNPDDSVLIVTIDEKEYLRLGLLLSQLFRSAKIQMVSSVISAKGSARAGEFSRNNEFIFFVMLGGSAPAKTLEPTLGQPVGSIATGAGGGEHDDGDDAQEVEVDWGRTKRNGKNGRRSRSKSGFYPIFLFEESGRLHSVGRPIDLGQDWRGVPSPPGAVAVWPIQANGAEQSWGLGREKIHEYYSKGYLKIGKLYPEKTSQKAMIYHLTEGSVAAADNGEIENIGTTESPRWIYVEEKRVRPLTMWHKVSHEAGWHGTRLLANFLPGLDFDFAKSLYAVEDALRFFVAEKPGARILDFFSGSGTTAHAVMRLNKQDGGRRQCISVTNNEVSAGEQKALRKAGLRPGDPEWEELGICDYVTKPRIEAAITGKTPAGDPIKGDYKFTDEFPMADGFEENAEFFTLTYEAPGRVARNRDFERIAPMLWMAAGSQGRRIDTVPDGWDVADAYGVLVDLDRAGEFVEAVEDADGVRKVFVVTDDARSYQAVAAALPDGVDAVRLYEAYLKNFEILAGRAAR